MRDFKDSLYPEDWKKYARKDWRRIRILLDEDDAEGAAFHLQQSLEKYLKAFLLENRWELKKIHDLSTLISYAVEYRPLLENFRDLCERVTGYYFTERYPSLAPSDLTANDIEKDTAEAREMVKTMFPEKLEDKDEEKGKNSEDVS